MLVLTSGEVVQRDDYAIRHLSNGLDELTFELDPSDGLYRLLQEGKTQIRETIENQTYLVSKINSVGSSTQITCRLDLSDWQKSLLINTEDLNSPGFSHTLHEVNMLSLIMNASGLSGWTKTNQVQTHVTRSMRMDGPTPLEAALQLQKTFGCALRFQTAKKKVTILYPEERPLSNSYALQTVNLRKKPEYKGRSTELITRLYPIGKDGLGIASVNNGVAYVEDHTYSDAVVCALWRDARYTDAASLKRDALARLKAASKPVRSWKLDVVDLNRLDPVQWPDIGMQIWTRILLLDSSRESRETVQVVSDVVYPYYPEKNQITVSTGIETLQEAVARTTQALNDPNGELWAQINARS